jgi:hypothetical protein
MIAGRSLSALEIVHELRFVDLRTAQDLAAVSQDDWLVQAEPQDYEHTRDWARWLRSRSDAAGFIWQSRRDRPNATYVVFADRCAGMLKVQEHQGFELDTPVGLARLNELLRPYRAVVDPG